MKRPRRAQRALFALLPFLGLLAGLGLWGRSRIAPPAVLALQGPEGRVVLRWVGPAQWRIEATSPLDEAFAEGVLDGLDAAPLLIVRRAAADGVLTALAGPEAKAADEWARAVGLPARLDAAWGRLDEGTRARLRAYADGVNAAWRRGLPWSRRLPRSDPVAAPWRSTDSLAVAVGLALAHPGWAEAEVAAVLPSLPTALRAALEDPRWGAASPVPDAAARAAAWRAWAAVGAAPEIGLFRECREGDGLRLAAMAAPVLPLPWRVEWRGDVARLRWPGLPGALAEVSPTDRKWLAARPGPGDPLVDLDGLVRAVLSPGVGTAFWEWRREGAGPACMAAEAARREALLALPPQGWLQRRVHGMLQRWDGHMGAESPSALVYAAWREELIRQALQGEIGADGLRWLRMRRPAEAILAALMDAGLATEAERQAAYRSALEWIGRHYGDLHTIWAWGKAHAAELRLLGWPIRWEIPVGGDERDLWPTSIDPERPYRTAFWPAITIVGSRPIRVEPAPTPWGWPWP